MATSNDYTPLYQAAGAANDVDPLLLGAIGLTEDASGDPAATSSAGAEGPMQFLPATAAGLGVTNPRDPSQAIPGAAALMRQNLNATKGDVPSAVAMYFAGPNKALWGPKTANYLTTVARNYQTLKAQMAQPASATPAASPATPGSNFISPNELDAAFGSSTSSGGAAGAQTSAPTTSQAAAQSNTISQTDLDTAFPPPPPTNDAPGSNFKAGLEDVLIKPGLALDRGLAGTKLGAYLQSTGALQAPTQDQATFNQDHQNLSNGLVGTAARVAGQSLMAAPIIAAGGEVLAPAAEAASAIPGIGDAIGAGAKFLSGGAGQAAKGIGGLVSRTASKAASGAIAGGAASALSSGASSNSLINQVENGAKYGAVLGPAAPLVGAALGAGGRVLGNALSSVTDSSPSATQAIAGNKLLGALKADGLTPGQAVAKMRAFGPDAILPDVAGPNVSQAAQVVAGSPGAGAALAHDTLEGRMAEQVNNVNAAIQQATGQKGAIYADADALTQARAAAAAPLYEKALAQPITTGPRLNQFLADPTVQKGLVAGTQTARLNALAAGKKFAPEAFQGGNGTAPSMAALDAAKQGLDDMVESYRDPVTHQLNLDSQGRAINNVRAAFVSHLDTLNPDYAAARAAYSGPSASLDAMHMGQKALTNAPEVTAKTVASLSDNDKQFFLNGLTRALQDKVNSTPDGANAVRRIFGNLQMKAKLQAAFPSPKAYDAFATAMQNETQKAVSRNAILRGSQTFSRTAGAADLGAPSLMEPATHLVSGNVGAALSSAARAGVNFLMRPSQAQNDAMGNMLFTPGNADELERYFAKAAPGPARRTANALIATAARGSVPAGTLEAQQLYGR